jgi:hypothetical protein
MVRDTYQERPVTGAPSSYRVGLALLNLVGAIAITVALSVQITDQFLNDAFAPTRYFSYFTIQTSLANIVVLAITGILGLQTLRDSRGLSAVRANFVAYAIITGVVYNILLRDLPSAEGSYVSAIQWPNEVTHVWIPLYFALDWIINPHRHKLPGWTIAVGIVFAALWLGFTLVRGELTGWYPYAFLNPNGDAGWLGVGAYAGGIAIIIIALVSATALINLIHHRLHPANHFDR